MWVGAQVWKEVRYRLTRLVHSAQDAYYGSWGTYKTLETDDIPDEAQPGLLYLVGDNGNHWIAAMRCPCSCGTVLEMNLLPDAKPVWKLSLDTTNRPTLAPSVWPRAGCGAHFHLRHGKIRWDK
jgi:hypothetical protein